jgi:hypothetical protein
MVCRVTLPSPVVPVSPAVQAVRDWCMPARERSWALQGLSHFYRQDVARLIAESEVLRARSNRARLPLIP